VTRLVIKVKACTPNSKQDALSWWWRRWIGRLRM